MAQSLFSVTRAFSAGLNSFGPFAVPDGSKLPGSAFWLDLVLDGDSFPTGTTQITAEFSFDGGVTWRGASTSCVMPRTWPTGKPHVFGISYSFDTGGYPTHARASVNAPSAFSTNVTLSTRV